MTNPKRVFHIDDVVRMANAPDAKDVELELLRRQNAELAATLTFYNKQISYHPYDPGPTTSHTRGAPKCKCGRRKNLHRDQCADTSWTTGKRCERSAVTRGLCRIHEKWPST